MVLGTDVEESGNGLVASDIAHSCSEAVQAHWVVRHLLSNIEALSPIGVEIATPEELAQDRIVRLLDAVESQLPPRQTDAHDSPLWLDVPSGKIVSHDTNEPLLRVFLLPNTTVCLSRSTSSAQGALTQR